MFNDTKQEEKSKIRRNIVKQTMKDKKIDNKSFSYFMDLVDDLSTCIDLKLGDIEEITTYDKKVLERMYYCGECLLNDEKDDISKEYIEQYIDSAVVEYAKFGYEVGLVFFKDKLKEFTDYYYGKDVNDYHEALVSLTKSLLPVTKKRKTNAIA